jgi:hypothetical protein
VVSQRAYAENIKTVKERCDIRPAKEKKFVTWAGEGQVRNGEQSEGENRVHHTANVSPTGIAEGGRERCDHVLHGKRCFKFKDDRVRRCPGGVGSGRAHESLQAVLPFLIRTAREKRVNTQGDQGEPYILQRIRERRSTRDARNEETTVA